MGQPRKFAMEANWLLRVDGIDRVRFSQVTIPDETYTDTVIRQSAENFPNRAPGNYQPVDVEVMAPDYLDTSFETLWTRTAAVVASGGPAAVGEELYFDADLVMVDRDMVTELRVERLHHCYCGGIKHGNRDADSDAAIVTGVILRPQWIEPIPVT
jgi:hypothetical protein